MIIEVCGISVQATKKRIKNMHLYVKPPDGRVEVSVPSYLSYGSAERFIRSKIDWIRARQKALEAQSRKAEQRYVTGEALYAWGKKYYLNVKYSNRKYSLILSGENAVLTVREGSSVKQRENRVNEWYREQLKSRIEILLPKWTGVTGLRPTSWQTKNMTTRWGTCNTQTGKIWFNLQLAKKPPECLEYIILHELAHLRVRNHGPAFTAILDRYMPDWRETRKKLNDSAPGSTTAG